MAKIVTEEVERVAWLVWGTKGEYSDRTEWPIAVYADEATAQEAAVELKRLSRDIYAIYRSQKAALDEAGDWYGTTLWASTEEGREFVRLHGPNTPEPGSYDFDDMEFTCCAVPLRTAAIEAMRASSAGGEVVERVYELRDLAAHNADKWTVELCDDIIIALQSQPPSNEARLREARNSWAALIGTNAAGSEDAPRIVAELNAELAALSNEGNG